MNKKQAEHDRTVLPRIQALMAQGRSRREIAELLQHDGVPTARRGGKWTHIAVGRILARADRPQPQEASPPAAPAEPPAPPTEQAAAQAEPPPPPAEPPAAPAPTRQESEAQHEAALQQLSTGYQEAMKRELGGIASVTAQEAKTVRHVVVRLWFWFAVGGVLLIGSLTLGTWGLAAGLTASIDSKLKERAKLTREIAQQHATLRELGKQTWGVGFHDTQGGKFITWPGHFRQPFKGAESDPPAYAGKWVAKLAEE